MTSRLFKVTMLDHSVFYFDGDFAKPDGEIWAYTDDSCNTNKLFPTLLTTKDVEFQKERAAEIIAERYNKGRGILMVQVI